MSHSRLGNIETDLDHRLLENQTVFPALDGIRFGPDQFGAQPLESAAAMQLHRRIERCLASERRQNGIRLFPGDDFLDNRRCDGFNIGPVGEFRIGHDGGRIRIDQNHLVSLLLERLAGLHARIIEFATLADDNGAGPDNEDFA